MKLLANNKLPMLVPCNEVALFLEETSYIKARHPLMVNQVIQRMMCMRGCVISSTYVKVFTASSRRIIIV